MFLHVFVYFCQILSCVDAVLVGNALDNPAAELFVTAFTCFHDFPLKPQLSFCVSSASIALSLLILLHWRTSFGGLHRRLATHTTN